jgi:hypothetical protein
LRVTVDPRVELLSIMFRLAGNPEYNQGRVNSYTTDVEEQFGRFRDHPVVVRARELRSSHGVSYDACMSMAMHLTDAYAPKLRMPLNPWPDGLDQRWPVEGISNFLVAAEQFVRATSFREFFEKHRALYETAQSRMEALLGKEAHLEWFADYFGERPQATFTVALGMLNGGSCYGPHCREPSGKEELYCILGVWETDPEGLPRFTHEMLGTIVHEFAHSYANAIMDRHYAELTDAGDLLFRPVAERMRSQAYGEAQTMFRESLVRACVVRYLRQYDGPASAARQIKVEEANGFLWMPELSELLAEYEAQRTQFPTLEKFSPRLVAFFKEYAAGFESKQAVLAKQRPKVLSMTPGNGAADVDPGLKEIQVIFDRPMKDNSWSLVGGGPHCPETTGKPHYDAKRTTWTVPVKLRPSWSYEYKLNYGRFDSFRSEEGVPLDSVAVTFETKAER